MNIQEIIKEANEIDGWFTGKQMELLYPYVKSLSPKSIILEVGTYRGKSTRFLALTAPESYVITIDPCNHPWKRLYDKAGFRLVNDTIDKRVLMEGNVMQIVKTSQEAARTFSLPIDFLFIDGLHEQCELDLKLWQKFVRSGGLIAFHDYDKDHPEVKNAVDKYIDSGRAKILAKMEYMAVLQKF